MWLPNKQKSTQSDDYPFTYDQDNQGSQMFSEVTGKKGVKIALEFKILIKLGAFLVSLL